jgi:outer membrane protein
MDLIFRTLITRWSLGSFFILGGLLFCLSQNLGATETKNPLRLNLREALRMAKERNIEVIVANERVNQAIAHITQERSGLLPQFNGSASEIRKTINLEAFGINIPNTNPLVGPFNSFDARISLTQTLFDFETIERLKSARVGKQLSFAELKKVEQDTMALVGTLYLEAERAQNSVALSRALVKQGEERLRLASSRLELGLGTPLEQTQLQAELADTRSRLTQAITESEERRLDLLAALGLSLETHLLFPKEKTPSPLTGEGWGEGDNDKQLNLIASHPDVEVAKKEVEQKKKEKKIVKAEYFPKIVGSADYGASGTSPEEIFGTYSYGGQLSIPIYQGGLLEGRMHEASSQIRESEARLIDMKQQTEAKILSAQEALKRAAALLKASQAQQLATQKQLSITQGRLQTGLGTPLEVIEATTQIALSQDGQYEAQATYQLAQVNLAHAMGRMESLIQEH